MSKQNNFETLNAALESEGLVEHWPLGVNISYGQHQRVYVEIKGRTKLINVIRLNNGTYERPIHYYTDMQ